MKGVSRKRDFSQIVNKLYAYGYGETEAQVSLEDTDLIFTYMFGGNWNGGVEIFAGDTLTDGVVQCVVSDITTTSGSWAAGSAGGTITATRVSPPENPDWELGYFNAEIAGFFAAYANAVINQGREFIEDITSQTTYGVQIARITDKRITHPATLLRWAQKVLAEYKDPIYYYTVDVVNLAEHPDFDFDFEELLIGQIVRVVNSDLNNLNVDVKIVSIETNLSKPEEIAIELANTTETLADSIGDGKSYQSLAQNTAVQIGAGQVTVQGVFTVDGWRTAGQTTIDGGQITADSVTASQVNFVVVDGTNVVGTINASTEGITISAAKIAIDGTTTFSVGYDPVTKAKVFAQDAVPTSISIGDLWVDTNDGNRLYRANAVGVSTIVTTGNGWYLVRDDGIAAALEAAATAQETADGEIVGFYQDEEPVVGMAFGDIWIDTDGHTPPTTADIYRYEDPDGGSAGVLDWRAAATNAIGIVYLNAYSAQETADTKITTFYQDGVPTSLAAGDLWVDTDDANKLYRAACVGADAITAGEWETVRDSSNLDKSTYLSSGTTTINGGQITTGTIEADAIKTSTLNAKTITLGTTGGDSIIKSGNYSAGSAGWQIKANGDAEFNNVTVRGTLGTCNIGSGYTITVTGVIQSSNYVQYQTGWKFDGSSQFIAAANVYIGYAGFVHFYATDDGSKTGHIYVSSDGLHLYFRDNDNDDHLII
jgi:hypothetical protein